MSSTRELSASVTIDASPEAVWAVLTDFSRMQEWSPETVRMIPVGRGSDVRVGRWYLGINKRGLVVWPTRNRLAEYEPPRTLAWDTVDSGARWIYELTQSGTGTLLTERRPAPRDLTGLSKAFAKLFLGGVDAHADELEDGMCETLIRIKAGVESR